MAGELIFKYDIEGHPIELTFDTVKEFIAGDSNISLGEFRLFGELCQVRKLNPFLKEAYLIKYGDKPAQLVVSKDVFMKRAEGFTQYDGIEDGIIVMNSTTGEVHERRGCCLFPGDTLVGAWAKVYRKDRSRPTYIAVGFNETASRTGRGDLNSMWATKGAMMCNKVAKTRALREAFPTDFSGMYEESEFDAPPEASERDFPLQSEPEDVSVITSVSFDEI